MPPPPCPPAMLRQIAPPRKRGSLVPARCRRRMTLAAIADFLDGEWSPNADPLPR